MVEIGEVLMATRRALVPLEVLLADDSHNDTAKRRFYRMAIA
jgi:hypothetical protein